MSGQRAGRGLAATLHPGLARLPLAAGRARGRRAPRDGAGRQLRPAGPHRGLHRHRRGLAADDGPARPAGRQVRAPVRFTERCRADGRGRRPASSRSGPAGAAQPGRRDIAPGVPVVAAGDRRRVAVRPARRGGRRVRPGRPGPARRALRATGSPGRSRWTRSSGSSPAPASRRRRRLPAAEPGRARPATAARPARRP